MVTNADRFGTPLNTNRFENTKKVDIKTDRFGTAINKPELFNSTSRKPKQSKEEEEGIIEKYIIDPVKSAVVGVAVGAEKTIEGALTLGTILGDMALGTDMTVKVQKAFDESKILNYLEDQAADSWTGTLTSVLTQFGIPGGVGLKVANGLIKAKKAGILKGTAKSSFITRRPNVTKALFAGGAEAIASTNDMGTLGDLVGMGPTQISEDDGEVGRLEAWRRLKNKFKFGVEGALGFSLFDRVIFPGGKKLFKGALPGLKNMGKDLQYNENIVKFSKVGDEAGRPVTEEVRTLNEGWQFNKNNIFRWLDKNIAAPFRARGNLPEKVFLKYKDKIASIRAVTEQVRGDSLKLEKAVQGLIDPKLKAGGLLKQLDEIGMRDRERLMESIYDFLTAKKFTFKGSDGADVIEKVSLKKNAQIGPDNIAAKIDEFNRLGIKEAKETGKKFTPIDKSLINPIMGIRNTMDDMSTQLAKMPGFTMKNGADFQQVVAANVGEYLTRSYRMFGKGAAGKKQRANWENYLKNTAEGQAIKQRARDFIKNENPKMSDELIERELEGILRQTDEVNIGDAFVKQVDYDAAIKKVRGDIKGPIRELLGEIKDPTAQFAEGAAKIATYIEDTKFFNAIKDSPYFFAANPKLTVKGKEAIGGSPMPGATGEGGLEFNTLINSDSVLKDMYTTPEIAKALEGIVNSQTNANQLSNLYNAFLLSPKAFTQEAKTTLSPITHARNLISAASFTGMNGNFFQNPVKFAKDFKDAWKMTTAVSKNQLETTMGRQLFKSDAAYDSFKKEYMELQRLGVVNTSVRLGDLAKTLDEVSLGMQNLSEEGKIYSMLRGWGDKTGFNKLRGVARTAYQAEDDLYKIQNFYSEKRKFGDAFGKAFREDPNKFMYIKNADGTVGLSKYAKEAKRLGIDDLKAPGAFDDFIKRKAADTVKNNIPNYDYVGAFGQRVRRLPVGNFVSFPLEIMRTGFNTLRQGLDEVQDPLLRAAGMRRLAGVATFGVALGKGLEAAGQAVSGVSNEKLNALKEYLPEWSKNSTLIPIKQNNQIYYIDFSHTNAYDVLTRPLNAAMNAFKAGQKSDESIISSFNDAVWESATEFASPFVEESIITGFIGDVLMRGGETREGKRIWNPQDSIGTKVSNTLGALIATGSPGSIKQFQRLYLSGTGQLDQYNRGYKFLNESTGLLGFRIQDPFIEDGIQFKIADNKKAVADSKKLFTSVAYKPNSTPEEIIAAYEKANAAKFKNDQILYKRIRAAEELGMNKRKIRQIVGERYSDTERNNILKNRFTPLKVSSFVYDKVKSNALQKGTSDPSRLIKFQTDRVYRSLFRNNLFNSPGELFTETINVIDDRSPTITTPKFTQPIGISSAQVNTPTIPSITTDRFQNTGTLNSGDRSQLAKSGNIDITEAIAERRT